MVEFWKSYANKKDIYPKNIEDMLDVMRQAQPKKKPSNPKIPKKEEDRLATSLAQGKRGEGEGKKACYCCGGPKCRWPRCEKKETLPIKQWHKPDLAPAYLVKRQEERQKKSCNNSQTTKKSGETTQAGFAT